MTPTVDVIIPVFNGRKVIEQTIQSVLAQTYPLRSVIIVNDGSTDDTLQLVQDLVKKAGKENLVQIYSKPNGGHASAVNYGILKSDADLVALLDADDLWQPEKITAQVKLFQEHPAAGVIYCDYEIINENNIRVEDETRNRVKPKLRGIIRRELLTQGNRISGSNSAVLIDRRLLLDCLFDEKLKACEDWDLWIRLAQKTEFDFVDQPLVQIRRHASNQSGDPLLMIHYELLVLDKNSLELGGFRKHLMVVKTIFGKNYLWLLRNLKVTVRVAQKAGVTPIESVFVLIFFLGWRTIQKGLRFTKVVGEK